MHPQCGKSKKPWFELCWDCNEHAKQQKPTCETCGAEVPEGHTLCKQHWLEKKQAEPQTDKTNSTKKKQETQFKKKYEGKYFFNSQRIKSKSELLICYFLTANQIQFQYETPLFIKDKRYRPDFVLDDAKGNLVILEHFGGWIVRNISSENKLKSKNTPLCANSLRNFTLSGQMK